MSYPSALQGPNCKISREGTSGRSSGHARMVQLYNGAYELGSRSIQRSRQAITQ